MLLAPFLSCTTKHVANRSVDVLHHSVEPKAKSNSENTKFWVKSRTRELTKYRFTQDLSGNLVVHSRFLFLEDIEMTEEEVIQLTSMLSKYPSESSLLAPYQMNDDAKQKYAHLIGKKIKVNNYNRKQYNVEIVDVVIVLDRMVREPYVAAVLNVPEGQNIYYAWTSNTRSFNYPFEEFESELKESILKRFENTSSYSRFEEFYQTREVEYIETTIQAFEHVQGKKYFVVQSTVYGNCSALIDNLAAVYKLEDGKVKLMALDQLDYFIMDMIDQNSDDFPELLGGDFSSSVIYTLENGEIEVEKELTWSSSECPC